MSIKALEETLKNCLINFNRRVDVTDLLQQFDLSYEEVHKILEDYLRQQESKGVIYEKRFLVHGLEKGNCNEVFSIVEGEKKLNKWLGRLEKAKAALYSVEVAGGSKSPAYNFKPIEHHGIHIEEPQQREIHTNVRESENIASVKSTKQENKVGIKSIFAKQLVTVEAGSHKDIKVEASEEYPGTGRVDKKSFKEKKKNSKAPGDKKGIGNYFSTSNKSNDTKEINNSVTSKVTQNIESPKQADEVGLNNKKKATAQKASPNQNSKAPANTSVQLFEEESTCDTSSDEEEKINALKRDIIDSDHEFDDTDVTNGNKRRRISDSDDEESDKPPIKLERREEDGMTIIDIIENDVPEQPQSETYLDEDGFVITVKAKKNPTTITAGKRSNTAINKNKSPLKRSPKKSPIKAPATKTKQAIIKNFFTKQ